MKIFLIGSLCFTIDIFLVGATFCNEWDFLTVMGSRFFVILIRVMLNDHIFSYAHTEKYTTIFKLI